MAVDRAPFDDPSACAQAFRLIPDRQALIDGALWPASARSATTCSATGCRTSPTTWRCASRTSSRRSRCSQQAGKTDLEVTLQTSDIVPGFVEAATLFAEQAKGAGVNGQRQEGGRERLLRHVAALHEDRLRRSPSGRPGRSAAWYSQALALRRGLERDALPGPVVRRADPQGAAARPASTRRPTSGTQVQQIQYDEGGYIVWSNQNIVDAAGQLREGHRCRARSSTSAAGTTATSGSTSSSVETVAQRPASPVGRRRSHPSPPSSLRRVAAAALTLFVVSILVFVGTEVLPGDAASAVLGKSASPDAARRAAQLMGLDQPAVERYLDWLGGLLHGDLGNSAAGYAQGAEVPIWSQIDAKLDELVHPRRRSRRCS